MKRKKYVKLVQSCGLMRNVACREERASRLRGQSYKDAWAEAKRVYDETPHTYYLTNVCRKKIRQRIPQEKTEGQRMTRQKYIKLLMGMEVPRNTANAMALAVRVAGMPYEEAYRHQAPWMRLELAVRRTVRNVTAAVMALAESVRDALPHLQEDDLDGPGGGGND